MTASNPVRTLHSWDGTLETDWGNAATVFETKVLEAFTSKTKFWDMSGTTMMVESVGGKGRTAQWPLFGEDLDVAATSGNGVTAGYHVPGDLLVGEAQKIGNVSVTCDDVLIAHQDVGFGDLDITHFPAVGRMGMKLGRSLGTNLDVKVCVTAIKAAKTALATNLHGGGHAVYENGAATVAATYSVDAAGALLFYQNSLDLAESMDSASVPEDARFMYISPYIRKVLQFDDKHFNRDYNPEGLAGIIATRVIGTWAGFKLIVTNNIPTASITVNPTVSDGSDMAKYNIVIDGANDATCVPAAVVMCGATEGTASVGMVQAAGLSYLVQADERRETYFLKARIMVGMDVFTPWTAGLIGVATNP